MGRSVPVHTGTYRYVGGVLKTVLVWCLQTSQEALRKLSLPKHYRSIATYFILCRWCCDSPTWFAVASTCSGRLPKHAEETVNYVLQFHPNVIDRGTNLFSYPALGVEE